jgi:hypothetical protein
MRPYEIHLAFAILVLAASLALPAFAEDYPMSAIPLEDPRWKNTLDRLNASIAEKANQAAEAAEEKTVEILQHIDGASYLAQMRTPQKAAGSAASAISRITGSGSSIVPAGDWETIRLDLPKESARVADGEKFLKPIEEAPETFEYTTALGAKATVRVCRIAGTGSQHAPLTMEQFVALLRAGETFPLTVTQVTTVCDFCRGAKVINGGECRKCEGKGGATIERNLTVRWSPELPL